MISIKQSFRQCPMKLMIVSLGVLFLDQAIKFAIVEKIIKVYFYKNYNFIFGIAFSHTLYYAVIATAVITFAVLFAKRNILERQDAGIFVFLGIMLGGIISNISDRIFRGYIVDYIPLLNIFSFNLADVAISLGALVMFLKIMEK